MRYGRMTMAAAGAVAVVVFAGAATAAGQLVPDEEAGAEIYAAQCRGCHTVSIAPTLRGIADRPIAAVKEFGGYSNGLKARAGEVWTEQNLDAFLAAPGTFAPGTQMVLAVTDPQARADVIAYIRTLPPPREGR